jgi:hypothetical protein
MIPTTDQSRSTNTPRPAAKSPAKRGRRTSFTVSLRILEYERNTTDIRLDSGTTIHCKCEFMENIQQWFIYILPNFKHLILSCSPGFAAHLYDQTDFKSELFRYSHDEQITKDYVYFSNIEDVEIKVLSKPRDHAWTVAKFCNLRICTAE